MFFVCLCVPVFLWKKFKFRYFYFEIFISFFIAQDFFLNGGFNYIHNFQINTYLVCNLKKFVSK